MRVRFRSWFRHPFIAALLGALMATAFPAMAAQVGDAWKLGQANNVTERTHLVSDSNNSTLQLGNKGGVPPLELKSQKGVPSLKVNRTNRVPKLNADRVDGKHANQLIRAASGSTFDVAEADGDAVAATITAPAPGMLVMSGSIEAFGVQSDFFSCRLTIEGTLVVGSNRDSKVHDAGGDHTDNSEENCSTDAAEVVRAGTYTVALTMVGRDTVQFGEAAVWVIWVPFDGTGAVPTP